MALLQPLRDVPTSSVHGIFAHWEVDRIKSFLADDEVLGYYRENPPQKDEPTVTERTMTVESVERNVGRTVVLGPQPLQHREVEPAGVVSK